MMPGDWNHYADLGTVVPHRRKSHGYKLAVSETRKLR